MLLKKNDQVSKDYDVIVIGSGLAGLTAANILGRNGKSVLLLEAHNKLGGFATWFYRGEQKEHIFDISLHGFPVGMIKTCKKYWSRDIANDIVQLKSVRFVNPQFNLDTTFTKEDYIKILVEKFKLSEAQVLGFFDHLASMNFYDNNLMTNRELFQKFFPDRNDVMRLLMEPIVYANGSTLDDPAITYGIVFSNFMSKGVYTFKGTTEDLLNKMKNELLINNVDIKLHSKVEEIVCENAVVKGIKLAGQMIKAKAVVSNSNLHSTIFKLAGEKSFSRDFIEKAKKVRLNSSSSQVYMGLKEGESFPFIGDLIFTSKAPEFSTDLILAKEVTSRTFSVYYPEHRPPHNRYTIVSSTNSYFKDWENLSEVQYEAEKQKMIDETVEALGEYIPDVKNKLDFIEAATPLTVKNFTLHEQGASFGTKFEGLEVSMNMNKEISGLFHSGSVGIIMSGWLGAANYGAITANNVESFLMTKEKNEL
ncbi:MAG: phytoene desaturase family protein [Bacteriovoracaceae bacterium]